MNLTRFLTSASRHSTTKTLVSSRSLSSRRTIMGLNGHAKQNGAPANLVPVAARLEEGRALNEDVWSIFKYVHAHCFHIALLTFALQ